VMVREPDQFYTYRRAFLMDLVAPPDDEEAVLDAIQAVANAAADAGADLLSCLHIGGWLTQRLKRSGFYLRAPERYLLVLPGPIAGAEHDRLLDEGRWYISQGDSDLDRP